MGAEFLFTKTGSLRKYRDRRKKQLGNELVATVEHRSILNAKCFCDPRLGAGGEVEICVTGDSAEVFVERNKIGFIAQMNPAMRRRIQESGGRMVALSGRYHKHSNRLEIAVTENILETKDGKAREATALSR